MNTFLTLISMAVLAANISSSKPTFAKQSFDINTEVMHLSQKAPRLNKKVLKLALTAYQKARIHGDVKKQVLTVIDYSLPSWKQRMWIFDLNRDKLLFNTYVAHGKNSGSDIPHHFSNRVSSRETSLGTYVTKDTYIGSKGYSLNLKGLEKGFNDNAYSRRVVVHGAWYVEPAFIKLAGHAGRSWGCPSIAKTIALPIINAIKGGVTAFDPLDDRFTAPLSTQQALGALSTGKPDTIPVSDLDGNVVKYNVMTKEPSLDSVYKYLLKEEVVFDKESSRLYTRILGIAPEMPLTLSDGTSLGTMRKLFWIYYPDLRQTLAKYEVYNPKNFGARMSWEDLFESRMFSSYITKTTLDNPFDQSLKDKYGKNSLYVLLEGESIKDKIFNYEQSLWSY